MFNSSFLADQRVKALIKFNEKYAMVMVIIFSLIPALALISPQSFGPLFTGIAQIEIYSFIFLGIFQFISYATFSSNKHTFGDRMKFCALKMWDSCMKNKAGFLFLIVYVLSIIAALCAEDKQRAFNGTDFRPDGIRMYTCFMVVFIYSLLIKDKTMRRRVILVNVFCFLPVSLVMYQQYFGIIGTAVERAHGEFGTSLMAFYDRHGLRVGHFYKGLTGSFYNLNHLGYYITVCTMLVSCLAVKAEKLSSKIMWSIYAVYCYFIIIMNDTFGCYLAIFAALVTILAVVLMKLKEKTPKTCVNAALPLILFICVNIIFCAVKPNDNPIVKNFKVLGKDVKTIATTENIEEEHAGSGRLEMWLATVDMIKEKPILGYGPDNLKPHYVEREVKLDRAHNEPLERAVATGVPSALIYYAAVIMAIIAYFKSKKWHDTTYFASFIAVVGYLVSSLFGVQLFYTGGFFFIFLAFAMSPDATVYVPEPKDKNVKKR